METRGGRYPLKRPLPAGEGASAAFPAQDWGRRPWLAPFFRRAFFLRRRFDDMPSPFRTYCSVPFWSGRPSYPFLRARRGNSPASVSRRAYGGQPAVQGVELRAKDDGGLLPPVHEAVKPTETEAPGAMAAVYEAEAALTEEPLWVAVAPHMLVIC